MFEFHFYETHQITFGNNNTTHKYWYFSSLYTFPIIGYSIYNSLTVNPAVGKIPSEINTLQLSTNLLFSSVFHYSNNSCYNNYNRIRIFNRESLQIRQDARKYI